MLQKQTLKDQKYFRFNNNSSLLGTTTSGANIHLVPNKVYAIEGMDSDLLNSFINTKVSVVDPKYEGVSGVIKDYNDEPFVVKNKIRTVETSILSNLDYTKPLSGQPNYKTSTAPVYGVPHVVKWKAELLSDAEYQEYVASIPEPIEQYTDDFADKYSVEE